MSQILDYIRETATTNDDSRINLITIPVPTNKAGTLWYCFFGRRTDNDDVSAEGGWATYHNVSGSAARDRDETEINVGSPGDPFAGISTSGANIILTVAGLNGVTFKWTGIIMIANREI